MNSPKLSRRHVLAAGTALAIGGLPNFSMAARPGLIPDKKAKNIIFLVADGMSAGVPTMLDHYLQISEGRKSFWNELMGQDYAVNGLQDTRSLNSLVTDSAAASSAWGSGVHIWNGQVNALADGTKLRPLLHVMKEDAKMRTGLVTTTRMTHATPAGFSISRFSRNDEDGIAEEYLAGHVDVLMGGGGRHFDAAKRKDKKDLFATFKSLGYEIARNKTEMGNCTGKKILGIYAPNNLPYTIDHINSPSFLATIPTLKEMSMKAIEVLADSSEGFILQIEAARVDHAAHSNDFAGLILDQKSFDETIQAVIEWALKDEETLVIITTDHGNSNPGLVGAGPEYGDATAGLMTLAKMKGSYEAMEPKLGKNPTAAAIQQVTEEVMGIKMAQKDADFVASQVAGTSPLQGHPQYGSFTGHLAIGLGPSTHVGWTGHTHTSDFSMLTAVGPGAEVFRGVTQNISYFGLMLSHRDLVVKNPTLSFEDSKKHMEKVKGASTNVLSISDHWA